MSIPYLKALEKSLLGQIDFCYVTVLDASTSKPVLIASMQLVPFVFRAHKYSSKIIANTTAVNDTLSMFYILVCGNVFMAGENGFQTSDTLDEQTSVALLAMAISRAEKLLSKQTKKKIGIQLFKEFSPSKVPTTTGFIKQGYQDFEIDMFMSLSISPSWNSMEDYLQSLKAKYRTKAKSVFKKASPLDLRTFSYSDIIEHQDAIDSLFLQVIAKSEYQFGIINAQTFAELKNQMGEQFIFRALWLNQDLVGFSTSFVNGDVLEANYVGIQYSFNLRYAVYQRLLYDYIYLAIEKRVSNLNYGRTSELLKSSLGAEPIPMKLYAKHTSKATHLLMASILKKVSPKTFELRKPFKSDYYKNRLG